MNTEEWEHPDPGLLLNPVDDEDWERIAARYLPSRNHGPLLRCVNVARENGAQAVFIETRYLGKDYRSEFAAFYSRTFEQVPDSTQRLHFFSRPLSPEELVGDVSDDDYLGFIVMRPSSEGRISYAALRPPRDMHDCTMTTTEVVAHLCGKTLRVECVPFTEQDTRLGVCAHAAAWVCHSVAAGRGLVTPKPLADFALATNHSLQPGRGLPSAGLTVAQLSDLFRRFGIPSMFYWVGLLPHPGLPWQPPPPTPQPDVPEGRWDTRLVPTICRHLNGGYPVLVGTSDHAFVICGFERNPDSGDITLIRHDDQQGPYLRVADPHNDVFQHPDTGRTRDYGPWKSLHVPMPEKAWLLPESAERAGGITLVQWSETLSPTLRTHYSEDVEDLGSVVATNELSLRTYVTASHEYKAWLPSRGYDPALCVTLGWCRMSRYIVVVEAIDRRLRRANLPCVIGEAVYDATSSDASPSLLALVAHGVVITRGSDGGYVQPKKTHSSTPVLPG